MFIVNPNLDESEIGTLENTLPNRSIDFYRGAHFGLINGRKQ